jgi:hypothetical protein
MLQLAGIIGVITQLGTSWTCVMRWHSIHRDERAETIYESGTVKMIMSHLKMKEVAPNVNAFVAIQETTCTGHSSLLNPQLQGLSTAISYVDDQCHSSKRTFQT